MEASNSDQFASRPGSGTAPSNSWIKTNGFILGLFAVVILAFLFPDPGAFCDSVKEKIWHEYGLLLTAQILLGVIALFGTVSLLIYLASHLARLNRRRRDRLLFLLGKKDARDGSSAGGTNIRFATRSEPDTSPDHVLSPVPVVHERTPGEPLGENCTTTVSNRSSAKLAISRILSWKLFSVVLWPTLTIVGRQESVRRSP
jgi:hypothetical protein